MNQWHNANEWPEDCKTVDSKIEVETITGKQLKCITRGWGFKENIPNENFVLYHLGETLEIYWKRKTNSNFLKFKWSIKINMFLFCNHKYEIKERIESCDKITFVSQCKKCGNLTKLETCCDKHK